MASNNNNDEDPYEVLGVDRNASPQQIRAAYRKLALKHHPDRQTSEEAKLQANQKFSSISHAYEILSDSSKRQEYDMQQSYSHAFPRDFAFHDPFQVFAHVFGQEFGGSNRGSSFGGSMHQQDPFFADPFFSRNDSMFGGGSMFGDSFFGGGGFGNDVFSQMHRQMDMMQQEASQPYQNGGSSSSYYYSSSSSTYGGNHNTGESVTTTTRMINGKRQTVTERVVRKPDGTVERHTETSGDDDFPTQHRLNNDQEQERLGLPSSNRRQEEEDNETQPSPWKKMKRRLTGGEKK